MKTEPLVFIHGIKGSVLKHGNTGQTHWLNGLQGIGIGTQNLKLPLFWNPHTSHQQEDQLIATQPLDKVTLIPYLIQSNLYSGILTEAPKHYQHFYPFAYDWRRSNLESVDKLLGLLKELHAKYHKPVKVIAHSMGGLITMVAMQQEPALFESVFFVGVPFGGGVGFLEDLHAGLPTGLNKQILSPAVLASMPSVYSLFPLKATDDLSDGQNRIAVDFYQPEDWERLKIGPWAYSFSKEPAFREHFGFSLKAAKAFREQMTHGKLLKNNQLLVKQPNIYVVLSKNRPTPEQFVQNGPASILGWDFKNGRKEGGDGRVAATKAYPPKGIDFSEFEAQAEHSQLLNDPTVLDWIFSK